MRLLLTDRFCARAKPGSAPQTDYFDETVKGLALRVGAKRKTWTLHLTVAGKRQRLTLGSYPSLSLAGARAKALTIAEGGPLLSLCNLEHEPLASWVLNPSATTQVA